MSNFLVDQKLKEVDAVFFQNPYIPLISSSSWTKIYHQHSAAHLIEQQQSNLQSDSYNKFSAEKDAYLI